MKVAQDQQKSYADLHRRAIEFQVGDKVLLKVSPMRGVMRFEVHIIKLDESLSYLEVPKEILYRKVRKTRTGEIVLLKILWSNHNIEEAIWEAVEAMKEHYPSLFDQCSAS
ncbi:uncharacterized protein LOC141618771 [Silene latifolia]|uniref:uncharacterized protein LOC141618771 n=1 Tax=Silene latifolia TaxID=37657 RepID=UPI003D78560B